MIEINKKISEKNLSGKMILQVHDELVFDVPEDEKDIFMEIIKYSMENIFSIQTLENINKNLIIPPILAEINS